MSADSDRARAAFTAERRFWKDLGDGRRVRLQMLTKPSFAGIVRGAKGLSIIEEAVHIAALRIVDWDLEERHVLKSGGEEKVPFDKELAADWLEVNCDLAAEISEDLIERFKSEQAQLAAATKN